MDSCAETALGGCGKRERGEESRRQIAVCYIDMEFVSGACGLHVGGESQRGRTCLATLGCVQARAGDIGGSQLGKRREGRKVACYRAVSGTQFQVFPE